MITNKWKSNISNSCVVQHSNLLWDLGTRNTTRKTSLVVNQRHLLSKSGNSNKSHFIHGLYWVLRKKKVVRLSQVQPILETRLRCWEGEGSAETGEEEEKKYINRGELLCHMWWHYKYICTGWVFFRGEGEYRILGKVSPGNTIFFPEHLPLLRENLSLVPFTVYIVLFSPFLPFSLMAPWQNS